jgi:hypothetical protein
MRQSFETSAKTVGRAKYPAESGPGSAGRYRPLGNGPAQRKQVCDEYQQRMTRILPLLFVGYDRVPPGTASRLRGRRVRPVD